MNKTDKELATELSVAFIQSWNGKTSTGPLKIDDAISVYSEFLKIIKESED